MGNAMHATSDSMLGNALDTISPMAGNDLPGMSFISNGTGDMSSAGHMSSAKTPSGAFTVLLNGTFQPVTKGPNVGPDINLSDGTYSGVNFYPVSGIGNNPNHPLGTFFAQLNGVGDTFVGYNVPGRGTMEMQFNAINLTQTGTDSAGDQIFAGTEDLTITAATGVFAGFVGGHNHMVDQFVLKPDGTMVEHCYCNITAPV